MNIFKIIAKLVAVLKREIYNIYLKSVHKNVKFGRKLDLERELHIYKSGEIVIGNRTRIRSWVVLNPCGGFIEIGENCSINSFFIYKW